MHLNIKLKNLILYLVFLLIILNEFLSIYISSFFSYFDDLLNLCIVLLGLLLVIYKLKNISSENNNAFFLLIILFIFYIFGILGNLLSLYQREKLAIFYDAISWFKFFGTLPIFILYFQNKENDDKDNMIAIIQNCALITVILAIIFYLIGCFGILELAVGFDRYGLKALTLGGHPSSSCAILAWCTAVQFLRESRYKVFRVLLCSILCLLTLRAKAIGLFVFALYFLFIYKKSSFKIQIVIITLLILIFASDQISYYFISDTNPRAVALKTSLNISKDFFPLGSGFATYGTIYSGRYYSLAYYVYGLNLKWGFMPEHYEFIGDGGFGTIIGQFGVIGCLLISIYIYKLFKMTNTVINNNYRKCILLLLLYLLISSTNEIAFSNSSVILFSFVISYLLSLTNQKYDRKVSD